LIIIVKISLKSKCTISQEIFLYFHNSVKTAQKISYKRSKTIKATGNLENLILLIFSRFFPVQKYLYYCTYFYILTCFFNVDIEINICKQGCTRAFVEGGGTFCAPLGNIVPPPFENPFFEKYIDTFFNYVNYSIIYTQFHITSVIINFLWGGDTNSGNPS